MKKVEVKVDGKLEETFTPGCANSDNCPFSNGWTLEASEYTVGTHEVEVLATDAVGNVSSTPLEIEIGQGPPQTSFTSPHPSHNNAGEVGAIAFKATREGLPVEGATFTCSLDDEPTKSCTSPVLLPQHFGDGTHTFVVAATDAAGKTDPTPATWRFQTGAFPQAPANEKLIYPEVGKKTGSYYTLQAEWGANPEGKAGQGVSGITFEMQLPGWGLFQALPVECTIDGEGRQVSWPIRAQSNPGHNKPVYLKVRGCPVFEKAGYPEKEIQFRAVFDGGEKVAGATAPVETEFVDRHNASRVSTEATETVGPASVDLLTGSFTLSRTDVSIPVPGYEANLEFTRTYSSSIDRSLSGYSTVLGGAWQPASPLESEYEGEAWTKIEEKVIPYHPARYQDECWKETIEEEEGETWPEYETIACPAERCTFSRCEEWIVEDEQPEERWIELFDNENNSIPFEIAGSSLVAPDWAKEIVLRREEGNIVLAYPNGTHTTFVRQEGTAVWTPRFISYKANSKSMRMEFETEPGGKSQRLVREIAPAPAGDECEYESTRHKGCRTLVFNYSSEERKQMCELMAQAAGNPGMQCARVLESISYYGPSGTSEGVLVARYVYGTATGVKSSSGQYLIGEYDPRLPNLPEWYDYEEPSPDAILMTGLDPAGQEPWSFRYAQSPSGASRLKTVARGGATTTLAYGVPTHGSGAPYDMGSESIARWGQTDLPVDATAVFPPNHVPAEYPPHEYAGATVHYMDPEGHQVNTASPSPPGVSGETIATTETDMKGNVVRELDPQNRLIALESSDSETVSHQLDSHSTYNSAGTEMLESWGPLHEVRLESGEEAQARAHTTIRYDEEEPTPPAGTPPAYLPTKEIVAAAVWGKEGDVEPKVTETKYEWSIRKPRETIVDPGAGEPKIRSVTVYNASGQVIETRQPEGAAGGTAGDTRTIYYSAAPNPEFGLCGGNEQFANLPCATLPAAQQAGRPEVVRKTYTGYDYLDQPTVIVEGPPNGGPSEQRTTTVAFDAAGRQKSTRIRGGGTELARTEARSETVYDASTGAPVEQKFVCEGHNCAGFDPRATKTTYNALGQVTSYEDADHAKTETKYDAYGRPVTVTDPKGTQTLDYDEASGLLTSMEVSEVGTFTAAYDADGDLIRRGLPNGLTASTTYNHAGEPTNLAYTKTSSCGESCTWYEESLERSIEGRILYSTSKLVKNRYRYDKAGRLIEAQETPTEGSCTTRAYTYDADSNRLTKTTSPGVGGACATTGGETQSYSYDKADRLEGPTYDAWGRITTLPGEFVGGKELKTSYFANDMVASQTQSGVTNTFQLDATGRQRQREQAGGVAGSEIFHYDGSGDSPSWTSLGSTWSRNIPGIGGGLAAIQESSGATIFVLTDLHGDAVASAGSSPTATELLSTARFTEFGEPVSGSAGRFGWLGGSSRRTELPSGVIQMGARSYIPQLGRFLTPDPILGGSANAYDYADQDPINMFDLGGECPKNNPDDSCHKGSRNGSRAETGGNIKGSTRGNTVRLSGRAESWLDTKRSGCGSVLSAKLSRKSSRSSMKTVPPIHRLHSNPFLVHSARRSSLFCPAVRQ